MNSEEASIKYYEKVGVAVLDDRAYRRKDDLPFVKRFCARQHLIMDLAVIPAALRFPLLRRDMMSAASTFRRRSFARPRNV